MLSPRTEMILRLIVSRYIADAVPVPSQSLVAGTGELQVSSATIRNEMTRLERDGYIIRPYTSAGSIPTDRGYRYYVETLGRVSLPLSEQRLISHLFHQVEMQLEQWLNLTANVVARLVQNMAVVTVPRPTGCHFKYLEGVLLQDRLALVILVLRGARVRQQLVTFAQPVSQEELTVVTGKLRPTYSGLTASQIPSEGTELSLLEQQVTGCVVDMMQEEDRQEYDNSYYDGWHFILSQPEFMNNPGKLVLMELIEHRSLLKTILPCDSGFEGVQVFIGSENDAEIIRDYSVVIGHYGIPSEVTGTLAVIGPTRLPYARAISAVSYLSSVLSRLMGDLYGSESHDSGQYY